MSESIRIALAVEGPTDFIVLNAAIESILAGRTFTPTILQPEYSVAFEDNPGGPLGLGWTGVYRWCRQAAQEGGGSVSRSIVLGLHDVLIVHVDADVAAEDYRKGRITDNFNDLPCDCPCPPPSATTDKLRLAMLRWLGETAIPHRCVLCTPSKSIEAWVMAALFPDDKVLTKAGWECYAKPEIRLAQLPKKSRIVKSKSAYELHREKFRGEWPRVRAQLSEAGRFSDELEAIAATLP